MKRKVICYHLSSENSLPMFRLNAPVVIGAKVKRCEQALVFIAMHYRVSSVETSYFPAGTLGAALF